MLTIDAILDKIAQIKKEIHYHKSEWWGMLGTKWEREDWQRKQKELRKYQSMLTKAVRHEYEYV